MLSSFSVAISCSFLDLLTYQPRSIAWAGWTRLPKTSQLPTPDYCSWPQPRSARQSVGKASLPHWKFWDTCALPKFKHAMRVRTTPLDPQVACHLPALGFRRVLEFLDRKIDNSPTLLLVNGLNGSKCHNQREVFLPGHIHVSSQVGMSALGYSRSCEAVEVGMVTLCVVWSPGKQKLHHTSPMTGLWEATVPDCFARINHHDSAEAGWGDLWRNRTFNIFQPFRASQSDGPGFQGRSLAARSFLNSRQMWTTRLLRVDWPRWPWPLCFLGQKMSVVDRPLLHPRSIMALSWFWK